MKKRFWIAISSILVFVPLLISLEGGHGFAPLEKWVAIYDGPDNGYDYASDWATDLAVDAKGYVYITGLSAYPYGEFSWTSRTATAVKYDTDGRRLWVAIYKGGGDSEPKDIAVDTAGNVYITGSWSGEVADIFTVDIFTIKYNADGKQLWVRKYNGPYKDKDKPRRSLDYGEAIAVDADGNVYVAGSSTDRQGYSDYVTIKYDRNGKSLWIKRFIGDISGDEYAESYARDIALDASGNVYVTGESARSGGPYVYATIKYNANGDELWVNRYKAPNGNDSYAKAIALDSAGNAYVHGESEVSAIKADLVTIKIDPNGKQLWANRFVGPAAYIYNHCSSCLAVDGAGNVAIVGTISPDYSWVKSDYVTVKYDTNGRRLWARRYNGPANKADNPTGLAMDGEGNVYVTGQSEKPDWNCEYATIKYNANGRLVWVKRYLGQDNAGHAYAKGIAVDSAGGVYVTGNSLHPNSYDDLDFTTIKY